MADVPRDMHHEADLCGATFLEAVKRTAADDRHGALAVLSDYTGTDDRISEARAWSLAAVAPLITAHVMRRHLADQIPPGGLWTLQALSTLPIEHTVEPSTLAAGRVLVEHLNAPMGEGNDAALDVVTAHVRQHGPPGMGSLLFHLIEIAAFLWRDGAFEVPSDKEKPRG